MLYVVDRDSRIIKRPQAERFGIPLFRWFIKEEEGWSFLATLRYFNKDTLQPWYLGMVQFVKEGEYKGVEFWLGNSGIAILFPSLRIIQIRSEHAK